MSLLGRIPQRIDCHFHFHFEPLLIKVTPIKVETVSGDMDAAEEQEVANASQDLNEQASK